MGTQRLVVKIGTSLLTGGSNRLNLEMMATLVGQVARLHQQGHETILVTSGAVAAGRQKLKPSQEQRDIAFKQVLAAVGQSHLMNAYEQLFGWHDIIVAQALLTRSDFDGPSYLNARRTLLSLLELRVVPIVNENDVVAVEELEGATIGDNDNLSAMVANLVEADLLVLLSDIPGLFTADPHLDPAAKLIPRVERIDAEVESLARGTLGPLTIGGMVTKIEAARLATASGIPVLIADGREKEMLVHIVQGETPGTLFVPSVTKLESRRRRLLASRAKGVIVIDDGAVKALREQGSSLLPVGITAVEGQFQRGEMVAIENGAKRRIACGIANYGSVDLQRIKGCRSEQACTILGYEYGAEVVHRNNMAFL